MYKSLALDIVKSAFEFDRQKIQAIKYNNYKVNRKDG